MSPQAIHHRDDKSGLTGRQKRAHLKKLQQAQVMPPHQVDLTLHPVSHEDMHVPAHVSGADLSHETPADANHGGKTQQGRDHKGKDRSH